MKSIQVNERLITSRLKSFLDEVGGKIKLWYDEENMKWIYKHNNFPFLEVRHGTSEQCAQVLVEQ
jgi:hypothetical protein